MGNMSNDDEFFDNAVVKSEELANEAASINPEGSNREKILLVTAHSLIHSLFH